MFDLARFICYKHLNPDVVHRWTLKQIFTFAQLNNWYHLTEEEKEREIIEDKIEKDKQKPPTREELIRKFGLDNISRFNSKVLTVQ